MLDGHDEHPRQLAAGPVLVELVRVLLRELRSIAFRGRVGQDASRTATVDAGREMRRVDDERVVRVRVLVEPVGKEHERAEFDRAAPELGQELALDPDVLHVFACPSDTASPESPCRAMSAIVPLAAGSIHICRGSL